MSPLIWRVEHFDEIDSTNTYLAQHVNDDVDEGLVVQADYQRVGRGRLDRRWESPLRSSLMCSILLRPKLDPAQIQWSVVAVALAARTALIRVAGLQPDLKWPNDLLAGKKKLAGVLAEAVPASDHLAVVVGIGINLTFSGPEGANATSVRDESGLTIEPRALLDHLLEELEPRRERLDSVEGRSALRTEYLRALATIGQMVRVERPSDSFEGTATGIDDTGQLLVDVDGEERSVGVGDLTHLRPVESAQ